ncbi:MAG TPA: hypothetical protein PKJ99_04765 [Thermoanaerobaculales bacterium]|nr:hypothetical protein [Thermoanaerobaculales bacterium]HQL30258.1 hypothetical protein [Thermoanaerobaculales bacterium]HQN97081.1 hypothetical protein [Thermoanaerobaculales bacterium]HQP42452.1 hypothetical protein [Thermoanaerobaculales bacterium]
MKRHLSVLGAAVVFLAAGVGVAFALGILNLPSDPVCVTHGTWNHGSNSTLDITLSGVPAGFDVTNGLYTGWCMEDNFMPDHSGCDVVLLDSTDTEPLECYPGDYPGYPWDKINYLLNHKNGTDGTIPATVQDIQVAMWLLTGTNHGTFPLTDEAQDLFDDADLWGGGFVPGPGEIAAVILCVDGNTPGWGYQDTLIEVVLFQGCTPGYWKQNQHLFAWVGYAPTDLYATVFSVTPSTANLSLLRALQMGGGGERALYRHATAALLNAANPAVNYPYTEAEIKLMVQAAYATGDFETPKDLFETANEAGCPLGNGKATVAGQGTAWQAD